MTWSGMASSWIHLIDEAVDMGFTLDLVHTGIMVTIVIIRTGGVIGDIFQMSSRKKRHLHLMEK